MGEPFVAAEGAPQRHELDQAAWVERHPDWLGGADELFEQLRAEVPWRRGRRWMYERMVDDPRLSKHYPPGAALPHRVLGEIRSQLSLRYGTPFGSVVLNYYRDGRDSVAFHRDRELRWLEDTLVAIVTLGSTRPFCMRPLGHGRAQKFLLHSGELFVMGGSCQLDWEHSVPKVASAGPRISISLRWSAGQGPLTTVAGGTRPLSPRGASRFPTRR